MMDDITAAFSPGGQYAFPAGQGNDDADQAEQRNRQIQAAFDQQRAAFDQQRVQRAASQNLSNKIDNQAAQIAQLRARQQQKASS